MKKFILTALLLFCLLPVQVLAGEIPVFNANGQKLALNPSAYTENDVTMLPLRAVAEYLGAAVVWQPSGEIIISKDGQRIFLTVAQNSAAKTANGQSQTLNLPAPPLYKDSTLFVPLHFIAEALDIPVNYCVNYQDDSKLPAVILGASKYAADYSFDKFKISFDKDSALFRQMFSEMYGDNIYTSDELNYIRSIFVGWTLGMFAEYCNLYQPFDEREQQVYDYLAFHIADEVLASEGMQQFLTLARHQHREIHAVPLKISVTEEKITGVFGFELFGGFLFIPLLAEVEITRCPDSLKALAPDNPLLGEPHDPDEEGPQTDLSGHMWRVTKVSNTRSYVNLQALRANEPEMYERWRQEYNLFSD